MTKDQLRALIDESIGKVEHFIPNPLATVALEAFRYVLDHTSFLDRFLEVLAPHLTPPEAS